VELNRGIGRELPENVLIQPKIISPSATGFFIHPENADLFEAIYCNCSCMENAGRQTNANTANLRGKTLFAESVKASRICGILE